MWCPWRSSGELSKRRPDNSCTALQKGDQTFLRQGDEMMPVRALAGGGGRTAEAELLVIVENEGVQTALVIDELIGRQQVLVRPLQGQFKDVADASACALLGEGQVGLVLKHGG